MPKCAVKQISCPCGYTSQSWNVNRHMGTCKKIKEGKLTATPAEALKTALIAKDSELETAKKRIAHLESQTKTTSSIVNKINNYLTVNVVPLLDAEGEIILDESIPEESMVREQLKRKRASEAVPTYLELKHFKTGPEYGNIRATGTPGARTRFEVIQRGADGTCTWISASKEIISNIVLNAFDELDQYYDVWSISELKWQEWLDAGNLNGSSNTMMKRPAFLQTVNDVLSMIINSRLPREKLACCQVGSGSTIELRQEEMDEPPPSLFL